ncbi:hypothetical protein BCR42DRAFT_427987 [Absidia repens]|uniref:Uncharacterized protein n=1 Tax=Absidia repens TaxID=90262 RepID=A0A1X2I0B0_9FUNG|nr:hypothetical protein BCR42DRAFT_427987 [Absidia repens]
MESFFAYSHSTASNNHQFPNQLRDIHGRVFSIGPLIHQYRLFVITLSSVQQFYFIFTNLHSLLTRFDTYAKDARFLILCPGSENQILPLLEKNSLIEDMVYWIVSANLAKQLQLYRAHDYYCGTFLLEVHANGYWQIIRQIELGEDGGMDWLTWSLISTRQESEQRAKSSVKSSQAVLDKLIRKKNVTTDRCHYRSSREQHTSLWGWSVCPLEIQHAILDQMAIPDIMRCAQTSDCGNLAMYDVIMTWLAQRLEAHCRELVHFAHLPIKSLQYHERQLSWLVFQIQPYLTASL